MDRLRKVIALGIMIIVLATVIPISPQFIKMRVIPEPVDQTQITRTKAPPTPIQEWNYTTSDWVASSPAVADVDKDGKMEVIVGSRDHHVYCLDAAGRQKWNYTTLYDVASSAAIADINVDGYLEIIVGCADVNIYCLNGTGSLLWSHATANAMYSTPAVADIDLDGKAEIVIGNNDRNVYCLNSTGAEKWSYATAQYIHSSAAIARIDSDAYPEIVIGSYDGTLYCLNRTGGLEWSYTTGGGIEGCPAIADIDGNGYKEIITASADNMVYCLNRTGGRQWNYTTGGYIESSPIVVWSALSGLPMILIASGDGFLYCLNSTGVPIWKTSVIASQSSPAVTDVDGDGKLEILIGGAGDGAKIHCLNMTGGLEWSYKVADILESSPIVADLDGDNRQEVLVGSHDNRTYCLSVASAPFNTWAYPWPSICFQGDIRHTGYYNDTDGDKLNDRYENTVGYLGTNVNSTDTDGDTASDFMEFILSTNPFVDTVPPARVGNLAVSSVTYNSITLTWTAPGDNGNIGTATGYILRYSTLGSITEANWSSATTYAQSWAPQVSGSLENHTVTGLSQNTTYWFAIQAFDGVHSYGLVSNSPSGKTSVSSQGAEQFPTTLVVLVVIVAAVAVLGVAVLVKRKKK